MKGIYSTLAPRVGVVAVVAEPVADGYPNSFDRGELLSREERMVEETYKT